AAGDLFVAGTTTGALPGSTAIGDQDMYLARFDKTGVLLWTRIFGTADIEGVNGLAVSSAGDAYVVGFAVADMDGAGPRPLGSAAIGLARYDKNGNQKWVRQSGSTDNDSAAAVAVAGSDVYVAGMTEGDADGDGPGLAGGQDAVLYRFSKTGSQKWV